MRAEDMDLTRLLEKDPTAGFPVFNGSRVVIMGMGSMGSYERELVKSVPEKTVQAMFAGLGYENGIALGMSLAEMFEWESTRDLFAAGCLMCTNAGFAIAEIEDFHWDEAKAQFHFTGRWLQSMEALLYLENGEVAQEPVCAMLSGLLSGLSSVIFGREVWVQEQTCLAQGNEYCTFEGRPIENWGLDPDEIRSRFRLDKLDVGVQKLRLKLEQAHRALAEQQAEIERLRKPGNNTTAEDAHGIIHRSKAMSQTLELARKVAPTMSTVLIQGESGVGKEVIARFIHNESGRQEHRFMAINCAALPPTLLESELFGHVKGAFTGADSNKRGLFQEAGKGTVFLDEVGELPLELQAKLLRALQEREIRPVGGVSDIPVEARIIAASNRELKDMVSEGRLREDLYYRLAVFPIHIPPLRQRKPDILPLARHFLDKINPGHAGFYPASVRLMEAHPWPGNVRELENAVEYAMVLAGADTIRPEHLPADIGQGEDSGGSRLVEDMPTQDELIRRYTKLVLESTGGNRSQAARILGIGANTLWRRLKQWQ